jgi:hypothetical protein
MDVSDFDLGLLPNELAGVHECAVPLGVESGSLIPERENNGRTIP